MHPIQMVDLKRQYKKIKSEIDTAVLDVIESAAFINGPAVQQLEISSKASEKYVEDNTGATEKILQFIQANLLLTR